MRYIVILFLLLQTLTADKLTLGAGPYIQSQPYKGVEAIYVPSPVIFFDNGVVYVRWTRIGVYFLGKKKDDFAWGFSLTAQPRPYGYKPSDSAALSGMDERKLTWEGGLAFSTSYKDSWFEIKAVTDILNKKENWLAKAEAGSDFELGEFSFYPSVIIMYQSANYNNYYYGVKTGEVNLNRNFYDLHGGFQIAAQTYIKYPLTKKLSTLINIRIDKLPNQAYNSPIVDDKQIYSGMFSLIYTFDF
jgi:outer membrane protein